MHAPRTQAALQSTTESQKPGQPSKECHLQGVLSIYSVSINKKRKGKINKCDKY